MRQMRLPENPQVVPMPLLLKQLPQKPLHKLLLHKQPPKLLLPQQQLPRLKQQQMQPLPPRPPLQLRHQPRSPL